MNDHATPEDRRATTADLSWMLWTAIGIGGIWVAVLVISLLAPDLVSGSEQQHLPVAAFATWFWGGIGTLVLLWAMGRLRGSARWQPIWIGLSVATLGIWAVATILAITLPVFETGSDPTRIPVAALFAPAAAAMLTALAGVIANVFRGGAGGGEVASAIASCMSPPMPASSASNESRSTSGRTPQPAEMARASRATPRRMAGSPRPP